jgi:hypothetical protein
MRPKIRCDEYYENFFGLGGQLRACLVQKGTQKVLQYLSHQILRHMHGVLNVDERKN